MKLTVDRHPPGITCVIGNLLLDGVEFCHTLERLPSDSAYPDIPAGTYSIGLTVSPEARSGKLWTPSPTGVLPLICAVPGRLGIRIHAGNSDADSRGCIIVGQWNGGGFLSGSRETLTLLMDKMTEAAERGQTFEIEVRDP